MHHCCYFQSYDVHLLVEALAKHEDDVNDVRIIPQSMEKYTSIITQHFRSVKIRGGDIIVHLRS